MAVKEKRTIRIKPKVFKGVILLFAVYFIYLFFNQTVNHLELMREKDQLEREVREVKEEIDELETDIYRFDDKEQIELMAREKLRMIGSDEVLINVREHMKEEGEIDR